MGSIEGLRGKSAYMRRLLVVIMVVGLLASGTASAMVISQPDTSLEIGLSMMVGPLLYSQNMNLKWVLKVKTLII